MQDRLAVRWRRAHWSCRRGMRELDVLLTRYVERLGQDPARAAQELSTLERLLEQPDPELQRWLLAGEAPVDPALRELVGRIRGPAPPA